VALIGAFYVMTTALGFGARAFLGQEGVTAAGSGGNLAAPNLAQFLGGGEGTVGGDVFLAIIAAVAFATILAVVAGLVLAAAGAVTHDLWTNVLGRGNEENEGRSARIASIVIAVVAILCTLAVGSGFNVSVLVSMAFVFAASANFPALVLALGWRRFNTAGALTGVAFGVIASVVMIALSPPVWPGPDSEGSPSPFIFPALITMPIGFLGCWIGTMLSSEGAETRTFDELLVRSELGLGSESGEPKRPPRRRRAAAAATAVLPK